MSTVKQLLDTYLHHLSVGDGADRPAEADVGSDEPQIKSGTRINASADERAEELLQVS